MKKFMKSPLMQRLFSPVGLLVVIGVVGGLMVSDLFRKLASRQAPAPSEMTGPLTASQAPLAFSEKFVPSSDNGLMRITSEKMAESADRTSIEISIHFHRRPEYKSYQIGSYEPPTLVDRAGGILLGTADFPTDHHFRGGETYRTVLHFPGKPASYPVTLTLFMGERFSGQFHMVSVVMTGLSPDKKGPTERGR